MCVLREIRHVEACCNRTAQQSCIVGDGSVIQGWQQRGSWNERETKRNETRNETKRNAKRVLQSYCHAPQLLRVLQSYYHVASSQLPAPQLLRVLQSYYDVASSQLPATLRTKVVLPSRQFSSSHSPATPRTTVVLPRRQFSASSSPAPPRTKVVLQSRQFSASSSTACSARIALSPAFRALDTHDLRRGSRGDFTKRALACISRTRHARSPQRVARGPDKSHSRLHFAHSARTISAEGCAGSRQIALSSAFRALDTHDLRRGLRADRTNRTLACISRTRRARSPQRVARAWDELHSRLHFAHSTRTISAEGRAHMGRIALSPAFRALDTHDLRRGLHFRLTLFVPPFAFKREFIMWENVFIRTSPVLVFHAHH